MKLKSMKTVALALVLTAATLSITDSAQAFYCYYQWIWTVFGWQYQYVCF